MTIDEAIGRYCEILARNARSATTEDTYFQPDSRGKKYTRIVRVSVNKSTGEIIARSAHSFVKREDGSVWKPDGWKGPAKNFSRGNVFSDGRPASGWALQRA